MTTLTDHLRSQHRNLMTMMGKRLTLVRGGDKVDFLAVEDPMGEHWFTLDEPELVEGDIVHEPGIWSIPRARWVVKAVQHNGVTGQEFLVRPYRSGWW